MRRELERAREETDGPSVYALATYYFVTGNYSLMVVLFGLGLMGLGATVVDGSLAVGPLGALEHGVFAGMFGVWGASFVVIGTAAYAVLWANKMYARLTTDDEEPDSQDTDEADLTL